MTEENAAEMRATMARWESLGSNWALNEQEEAALLGDAVSVGRVDKACSWQASRLDQRMRLLVELGAALETLLGDKHRVCAWLRRPRGSINGKSPIDVMSSSVEWIRSLHRAALDFAA